MYLLKLCKFLVTLADFPFVLSNAYLNCIFSVRLLLVFRLFDDCLAHCDMNDFPIVISCSFLS